MIHRVSVVVYCQSSPFIQGPLTWALNKKCVHLNSQGEKQSRAGGLGSEREREIGTIKWGETEQMWERKERGRD